jgi:hypothetical protein
MHKKILAVAIAATLAGCGNPASNGAGTEQNSMGALDSGISWAKKLARGFSAKASMQIPAQGAIADALLDPKFLGGSMNGSSLRGYSPYFQKNGLTMEKVGPGSENSQTTGNQFLVPVAAITSAYRGWQINLMDGFGEKKSTDAEIKSYLGFQEASVEYTNALFTQIAASLNADVGVLEDPEAAKLAIQRIYKAIPKATLKKLWADAVKHADERGGRIVDMSGTQGVDWSADGGSYSGNPDGLIWTKSGVAWFGKGALSGKQWTIGLESSISKSTDQSSAGSENNSASTGEKTSGGAQPK